jgi:hypothetical protein
LVATTLTVDSLGALVPGDIVQYFSNDGSNFSGPWTLGFIDQGFGLQGHAPNVALSTWGVNVLDVVSQWQGHVAQRKFRPDTLWDPTWTIWNTSPITEYQYSGIASVSWGPERIDLVGTADLGDTITAFHDWYNTFTPAGFFGTELLTLPRNCLIQWQNNTTCAQPCLSRTQGDQAACVDVLNCYENHHCGPSTCATGDQVCGPNTLGFGNAPYPFAQQVFNCIPGCAQ